MITIRRINVVIFAFFFILLNTGMLYAEETSSNTVGTWVEKASMPEGKSDFYPFVYNNMIYAIGGRNHPSLPSGKTNSAYTYSPTTNRWETLKSMPRGLREGGAIVCNDKVYVFGGALQMGGMDKTLYIYDISKNTWSQGKDMPKATQGARPIEVMVRYMFSMGEQSVFMIRIQTTTLRQSTVLRMLEVLRRF